MIFEWNMERINGWKAEWIFDLLANCSIFNGQIVRPKINGLIEHANNSISIWSSWINCYRRNSMKIFDVRWTIAFNLVATISSPTKDPTIRSYPFLINRSWETISAIPMSRSSILIKSVRKSKTIGITRRIWWLITDGWWTIIHWETLLNQVPLALDPLILTRFFCSRWRNLPSPRSDSMVGCD